MIKLLQNFQLFRLLFIVLLLWRGLMLYYFFHLCALFILVRYLNAELCKIIILRLIKIFSIDENESDLKRLVLFCFL